MLSQNQKKQTKKMVEKKPLLRKEYEDYLKKAVLYPDYKNLQLGETAHLCGRWCGWDCIMKIYAQSVQAQADSKSRH
jgi:hypothetical protein